MKWLILFISFSVSAEPCRVDYKHNYQREAGTDISPDDMEHELWIDGQLFMINQRGNSTRFMWAADVCPPCDTRQLRTVDTVKDLPSVFVPACSPPAQPVICQ